MIKIFTTFLLVCVVSTIGAKMPRIANGKLVPKSVLDKWFSFMTYVEVCSNMFCQSCSGSLVAPNRVLTAAKCFCLLTGKITINVWVKSSATKRGQHRSGYRLMSEKGQEVNCKNKQIEEVGKDIALIGFDEPFKNIDPVPLFCEYVLPVDKALIIGYGLDTQKDIGKLHMANGKLLPCPDQWLYHKPICMGVRKKVPYAGFGDTGGPLLIYYDDIFLQAGIFSSRKTLKSKPHLSFKTFSVWNSVALHCDWIKSEKRRVLNSVGERSTFGMTGVMIQSFVVVIVLHF